MAQHQLNVTEIRSREYIGLTSDEGSGNSLRQGVSGKACGDMLDGADGAERSTCMSANVCCSAGQTHGPRDHVHNLWSRAQETCASTARITARAPLLPHLNFTNVAPHHTVHHQLGPTSG